MSWGSELWCGSLPGARDGDAGLHSHAGGRAARDQPVLEFVLPEAATRQPRGPAVRRTDRGGLRRKTRVRISPGGLVAATKGKSSGESLAGAASDARTTEERVGPRGSSRAESNRAVGNEKEEDWTAEYRSLKEARASIARWIEEYNHDRPHRGVGNRTPHEAFLAFAGVLKNEALTV